MAFGAGDAAAGSGVSNSDGTVTVRVAVGDDVEVGNRVGLAIAETALVGDGVDEGNRVGALVGGCAIGVRVLITAAAVGAGEAGCELIVIASTTNTTKMPKVTTVRNRSW